MEVTSDRYFRGANDKAQMESMDIAYVPTMSTMP